MFAKTLYTFSVLLFFMEEKKRVGVGFGVMLLQDGKILLGRRHDDPQKAASLLNGAGTWTMPGGKLNFGESFEDGAKREVLEETGIVLRKARVLCVNQDMVESAHFVTIGLFADEFSGKPKVMEPDEITEWRFFDLDNLPTPLYFPSEKFLKNYHLKKFYIPG
jgi:8-oxo-dGTP diphosphatase